MALCGALTSYILDFGGMGQGGTFLLCFAASHFAIWGDIFNYLSKIVVNERLNALALNVL